MAIFQLRDIDPVTWEAFKAQASAHGLTAKAALLLLVAGYAHGTVTISASGRKKERAK